MSVYRPKTSPFYQFDFQFRGHRFHGSTKRTNEREAEKVERQVRQRAEADYSRQKTEDGEQRNGSGEKRTELSLTMDKARTRYWDEVGQYHAGKDDTWTNLERLVSYFGADKLLMHIDDDDVAKLVAWRRGQCVKRNTKNARGRLAKPEKEKLVANATVNRSTTEVLKKLFVRARKKWKAKFEQEPDWKEHRLSEPEERVRELVGDESERLDAATPESYAPFFAFARESGFRLRECLLKWSEVDWDNRRVMKKGKGGKTISAPITPVIREILWALRGHHPEFVFTYVAARTRGGRVRGQRYAISYSGAKITWRRLRSAAGVADFRFHDLRHDLGTKLLRETGNLKIVQRALNHRSIKTTTRYAHVLDSDVAAALEQLSESRNFSRSPLRKVS